MVKENTELVNKAISLAEKWQKRATELVTDFDKKFYLKMNKMLSNPMDKVLLIELMDQGFRSSSNKRVADQIEYLFNKYGMASFFTTSERFLLFLFRNIGVYLPDISIPLFVKNIREDTKTVVLKGEDNVLNEHLIKRHKEGTRVNINLIGEIVLGEDEAESRIQKYLNALSNPNIDYISIKISTIFSQINPLSFENTIDELVTRLSRIFAQAQKYPYTNAKGEKENKFINLDMEEYRDLSLTVGAFTKTLDKPEFQNFKAGIVLQAYLPDSHAWQVKLRDWAKTRVENGGVPVKVRLVKGANMEMEETESSLRNWEITPFTKKIDTDSHYKLMAEYGLDPQNAPYVHLGIASHNLFEHAYAYELAKENGTLEYYSMEMLEGMSEPARLAITELTHDIILYGPTAKKEQFTNAIGYLVRRLDENTGEDNFIRYSFGLEVGTPEWEMLKEKFVASFANKEKLVLGPKRKQNRLKEDWSEYKGGSFYTKEFHSEPDTDFVLPANKEWAKGIRDKWMKKADDKLEVVPVVVGAKEITQREIKEVIDKSQIKENVLCGKYALANAQDLTKAVEVAKEDPDGWRDLSHEQRHEALCKVANVLRAKRADLIGVAAAEVGKVFSETDVEVSEAIDFLEFYSHAIDFWDKYENLEFKGKGVGVVTPPWNFPIAIPVGGVTATLAAGNTVIIKPASVAALSAYELCKCFWEAGISKNVLQFVPCSGSVAGEHLVKNPNVDFVILTGGESTAYKMLESRPNLFLAAETGGKDATIVTSMADREQAIKNVIASAFNNSGQKCSATSLLILEEEVYNDKSFRESLVDAAKSVAVGSVWNFVNRIGALANPIGDGALKTALESLEPGEEWALAPEFAEDNKYMLKPSIKWGVKEGSFCHMTELFGPVLSVMCAKDLKHAIEIVNATGYGLTSGIESLDAREIEYWRENLKAGNLYINRGTTGAIVLRQPFGGTGKSAIGTGRKAGFYNYISQFMHFEEKDMPKVEVQKVHPLVGIVANWVNGAQKGIHKDFKEDFEKLSVALGSYLYNYDTEFKVERDYFKIRGEDNIFRYLPLSKVALRVTKGDSLFDVVSRIIAAKVSHVSLHVSIEETLDNAVVSFLFENKEKLLEPTDKLVRENEQEFAKSFKGVERIIYACEKRVSDFIFAEAAKIAKFIIRTKPMSEGRVELMNFFEEQSISHSYHRYGNIGIRGIKQ